MRRDAHGRHTEPSRNIRMTGNKTMGTMERFERRKGIKGGGRWVGEEEEEEAEEEGDLVAV